VEAQLQKGSNFTLPAAIEGDLAEQLVDLVPSAEMVKFAKNGSDVTSAAVRLSRAYTNRDYIACCGDGSFFSGNDWFIGLTACDAGIPKSTKELTLPFSYNNLASLEAVFNRYPEEIAAVILEPVLTVPPVQGYLEGVRELTRRHGAVLIFDEMITGFRWHVRGAQTYFNVTPDLSTFGKAIGNGFSVSALVGRRDIMDLGGLYHDKEKVFLLSLTHGGETHSIAAAIATINELRDKDVISHIWKVGEELQDGFNRLSRELGLGELVTMKGYPCSPIIICRDQEGEISLPYRTLFLQDMIANGVLVPYIAPSFSHTEREVEITLNAARNALTNYKASLNMRLEGRLHGLPVKSVFRRYN
jgi:glutamate-1-semialdehyde 2,1-aminomutase